MPTTTVNRLKIELAVSGDGQPVVFVHGSWSDHHAWDAVVPHLPDGLRLVRYSRRGHSGSECPPGQGTIADDVDDLAAVIETVADGRAHVVGNSLGAEIALRLAISRPELVDSVALHEPGFWGLAPDAAAVQAFQADLQSVIRLLETGAWEDGARLFADQIFGPGAWDTTLPEPLKRVMTANAPTLLDEELAADASTLDTTRLADFSGPIQLSTGEQTAEAFRIVVDRLAALLPHAELVPIAGAGHIPHRTHPEEYAALLTSFWGNGRASGR